MSLSKPLAARTEKELEGLARFHEAAVEIYEKYHEPRMAEEFRKLAATYRNELARRNRPASE